MTVLDLNPEGAAIIDRSMRRAVSQRVFPGAVLLVMQAGHTCFERAYGHADLFRRHKMTPETVFDLASLTKPLATALVLLDLIDDGSLSLTHRVAEILPAARGGAVGKVTLGQLLDHTSGLDAWRAYYQLLKRHPFDQRRPLLLKLLLKEPLLGAPGTRFCYSDLGYLLLGEIVAAVSGRDLDDDLEARFLAPLGIGDLGFAKMSRPVPFSAERIAATELCPWRGRLLKGRVHDDNAWVLGGVAGHAGLFGTAAAVGTLVDHLLKAYHGDAAGPLSAAILRRAWRRERATPHGLGFDFPAVKNSSAGGRFSFQSVGHLGFTGTSFWVDLPRRITVVLLSNRVHPTRHHGSLQTFRPLLHDVVMNALLMG